MNDFLRSKKANNYKKIAGVKMEFLLFLIGGGLVFWIMHSKLKYDMRKSMIVAIISGFVAPFILILIVDYVKLIFVIAVIVFGLFYVYKRKTENTEIRKWKAEAAPVISVRDFSEVIKQNVHAQTEVPYNRTQYFSAGIENIDTENDYAILYDAHPEDNEMMFREYGYLVTTRGIIIKEQKKSQKTDDEKYSVETITLPFQDVYKVMRNTDTQLDVFYADHSNKTVNMQSEKIETLVSVLDIAISIGWSKISKLKVDEELLADDINVQLDEATDEATRRIKQEPTITGGMLASLNKSIKYDLKENQINDRFGGGQGHGHVGEQYGDTLDRLKLKKVSREGATHKKNGADRIVDGEQIQTKYCKSAGKSVGQVFSDGHAKYTSGNGVNKKMMTVEVPRDQYENAIKVLSKRIENGEVPNESNPQNAIKYVKKGAVSYEHSQIATKSIFERKSTILMRDDKNNVIRDVNGNPQLKTVTLGEKMLWSAGGDFMTGVASSMPTAVVSSVWIYCNSRWHGVDEKNAMKSATLALIKPVLWGGGMYMLSSQFAGSKIGKSIGNQLFSGKNLSTLEKTTRVTGLTLGVATVTITFGPDVFNCLRGRISTKQLVKNSVVTGTGMATGSLIGGAVGTATVPGVGTAIGTMIGGAIGSIGAKKVMDRFVEDDAVAMIRIAKEEFIESVLSVPLEKDEVEGVLESTFLDKKFNHQLQLMFASENPRQYIHSIYFDKVVSIFKERPLPEENELLALV